jgi:quercetin dioxygenase-like cupin family protein
MLIAVFICCAQSVQSRSTAAPIGGAKPLLLEKNEGELRVRRAVSVAATPSGSQAAAAPPFILKVSPKNNGSERLVLVTEEIPPGAGISKHKHLGQDEILLIQTGTAHVWLGDQERDLHAGGLVFIPSSTWIRLKNIGTESISLVGIFSAPGFEDFRRCRSVPANEEVTSITPEEIRDCAHQGHLEAFEDTPKN